MQTLKNKIVARIYGHGRGSAFSSKDFVGLGDRAAVDKTLSLLARDGILRRLGRGIYDYPRSNPDLGGQLGPDFEQVAKALARKLGVQIQPHGAWAANLLGLSSQVPAQIVYFTNGHPKTYRFGRQTIVLRRNAPGKFRPADPLVALIAGALRELSPNAVDDELKARLRKHLAGRNRRTVLRDAQYLEGWIADLIRELLPTQSPPEDRR
jgi:hypothetical protein